MRVLFVPYGMDLAPATRYRVLQYIPYLEAEDIECRVFSAISKFSTSLMLRSPDFSMPAKFLYYVYIFAERLFRCFFIIGVSGKFDIIFLQRTTFPLGLEILLKFKNKNIIFDIDDAIFLPDKEGNDPISIIKKYIKKKEVTNVLKISKAVLVENEYIKQFVSKYCDNIVKIPGPIDTDRFFAPAKPPKDDVIIGWIGSPATTFYLRILDNVFKVIAEKYDHVRFKFIGLGNYKNPYIKVEKVIWSQPTEVKELQSFDIGVMPMPDNEWTRGKLGCKMLQYMACGIPAVVSYTPTNAEIIKSGENGFFAATENEWIARLSQLIEDQEVRKRIGKKGRDTVSEFCSLETNVGRLMGLLKETRLDGR